MEKFFKHPGLIAAVIAAITVFFAVQLPNAELDNNNFRFIPENDPDRLASKYIDDTFGSQIMILVGLERKYGTVLDAEFLAEVRAYGERVSAIGIVDSVTSIITSDYISGEGDSILVEPLVPDTFSGSADEIARLKSRLLSWDLYREALVSDDFTATQVLVSLDIASEDAGSAKTVAAFMQVKSLAHEMFPKGTTVYVTGIPVFSATINEAIRKDLVLLIPLVILVVLLVLFFSFRALVAIVLPLVTVLIATIWSIGAMPLFGVRLSVLSTVLPVILVAVGSAYGIHVVTHYLDDTRNAGPLSKTAHRDLVFALLRKIGKPVFLAALTTFVGFVSFCFTQVVPIREFGFFSSFGVVASFAVAVTLIPSLLLLRGPRQPRAGKRIPAADDGGTAVSRDRLSEAIADAFTAITRKKRFILLIVAAAIVVSGIGVKRIIIDNVMVEYFRSDTDISRSDEFIRRKFGGSKIVSIVVSSNIPGEVLRPDVLAAMDGLSAYLSKNVKEVGKVTSFTDLVKRINQVYNADESPDGIAPAAEILTESGEAGFGDFGSFGSFDSGDAGDGSAPVPVDDVRVLRPAGALLDETALVAALDAAVFSGGGADMSAEDLVLELKKKINYQGASYYEIPVDPIKYGKTTPAELRQLVSNYLVLLSGDIDSFANDPLEPTAIRMNLQLRTVGQLDSDRALDAVSRYVADTFPADVEVMAGGTAHVEKALNRLVVQSQLTSIGISLLMVFLIIAVSYRSIAAGLIGLAPLSITILLNFAVMGFIGIKLNIGTALVASLSVGIGIDYTIHYLAAYHREFLVSNSKDDFLRRTFFVAGKAIMINAVSVGAGFAVLMLSQFRMLADLGFLIAFTMGTSALVSLTILPVLLMLFEPAFLRKEI